MHCGQGGCPCLGGVPAWGVVPAQGAYRWGVYLSGECTCPGVYLPGVYLPRRCTCLGGGGNLPRYSPSVDRMTYTCKNITLNVKIFQNKNAFQWDAYHPLVDHIPTCTVAREGVPTWGCTCLGVYLPGGWGYLPRYSPLCGQNDRHM